MPVAHRRKYLTYSQFFHQLLFFPYSFSLLIYVQELSILENNFLCCNLCVFALLELIPDIPCSGGRKWMIGILRARDTEGSSRYPSNSEKSKATTTGWQGLSTLVVHITDSLKWSSIPFKSQGPHSFKLCRINPTRLKHMPKNCQKLIARTCNSNT